MDIFECLRALIMLPVVAVAIPTEWIIQIVKPGFQFEFLGKSEMYESGSR